VRPRFFRLVDQRHQQDAGREPGAVRLRRLAEPFPYLILDARYEKVREAGVIASQAVMIAIGIDWDGRRQVLGVELANRESRSSWRDFLLGLRQRGLSGIEFVVADDHAGLRAAIREVLPEAAYQRCYVHFLRNALDYVPRKSLPTGLTRGGRRLPAGAALD
jgi:transposase-like protein